MAQNARPENRPPARVALSESTAKGDLYEQDFFLWTSQQAQILRRMVGKLTNGMDAENLATEIEDLGKRDFRSLQSHCSTAIEHMIKIAWSKRAEPRAGWLATVRRSRDEIRLLIEDSPSLVAKLEQKWNEVHSRGFLAAYEAFLMINELPGSLEKPDTRIPSLTVAEFLEKDFHPGIWISKAREEIGLEPLTNTAA